MKYVDVERVLNAEKESYFKIQFMEPMVHLFIRAQNVVKNLFERRGMKYHEYSVSNERR